MVTDQLYAPAALHPREESPPVPIIYKAEGVAEPVWTLWTGEKSLAPAGKRTPAV
jgi:hypothetical protein